LILLSVSCKTACSDILISKNLDSSRYQSGLNLFLREKAVTGPQVPDLTRTKEDWEDLPFSRDLGGLEYIDEFSAA
jgi:hypothetical protein